MTLTRRSFIGSGAALGSVAGISFQAMAANDRIQVGVIGAGARSHQLIDSLLSLPGVEVVGLSDAYKGRVERAIDQTNGRARAFKDYRDMLAQKPIDAVVVVTPEHWHKQMVLDAVAAGKDVYCEKPLTLRASEGPEIIAAARSANRIVQVGSNGMSSPTQNKAKEIIKSGKIGQVTMIRAAHNRNTNEGAWIYPIPPDASPATVDWDMFLGSAPKRPFSLERFFRWRCFEDYSGGIATDLFVHLCTTINFLMDARVPSRVMAMGEIYRRKDRDVPDTLNAILEYPEGFIVNLSSTFNNQSAAQGSFQFLGSEGTVAIGGGLRLMPEVAQEDTRWIVDSWPRALEDAYYRDPEVRAAEMPETRKPNVIEGDLNFREEGPESTTLHLMHWEESIRTRKPYWEDAAAAGHHAAACAHMINLSAKQKRMVEWDYEQDDIKKT